MERKNRSASKKQGVCRLEQRALLAADIGFLEGFVTIEGTADADVVNTYVDGDQFVVEAGQLDDAGMMSELQTETFALSDVEGIFFNGGDGNDVFANDSDVETFGVKPVRVEVLGNRADATADAS